VYKAHIDMTEVKISAICGIDALNILVANAKRGEFEQSPGRDLCYRGF